MVGHAGNCLLLLPFPILVLEKDVWRKKKKKKKLYVSSGHSFVSAACSEPDLAGCSLRFTLCSESGCVCRWGAGTNRR